MRRMVAGLVAVLLLCICTACGSQPAQGKNSTAVSAQNDNRTNADTEESETMKSEDIESMEENTSNILVAYFSRTGNTEVLAEMIEEQTGGNLFEITPAEPYLEDYDETVERFRRERDENARPEISNSVEDIAQYDVVFVGFPNWGDDMPHIVYTFLEQYDFSGKTLIPFCTNGGGGFGNSIAGLESTCPNSMIAEGFECSGSNVENETNEVVDWIGRLRRQSAGYRHIIAGSLYGIRGVWCIPSGGDTVKG